MFFKLEFKTGVGGGFLRAFTSQKGLGPGTGLPASGFAPERRESPDEISDEEGSLVGFVVPDDEEELVVII